MPGCRAHTHTKQIEYNKNENEEKEEEENRTMNMELHTVLRICRRIQSKQNIQKKAYTSN